MPETNTKKALLVLDLDYTLFFTHKMDGCPWIGEKYRRVAFLRRLKERAEAEGVELGFAVVTAKSDVDELCCEAARELGELLQATYQGGAGMLRETSEGRTYCLVHQADQPEHYTWMSLDGRRDQLVRKDGLLHPLFEILSGVETKKSKAITRICDAHGVSLDNCLLVDDTESVLREAQERGIQTVSAEAFRMKYYFDKESQRWYESPQRMREIEEPGYIEENLNQIEMAIEAQVEAIINNIKTLKPTENTETQSRSSVTITPTDAAAVTSTPSPAIFPSQASDPASIELTIRAPEAREPTRGRIQTSRTEGSDVARVVELRNKSLQAYQKITAGLTNLVFWSQQVRRPEQALEVNVEGTVYRVPRVIGEMQEKLVNKKPWEEPERNPQDARTLHLNRLIDEAGSFETQPKTSGCCLPFFRQAAPTTGVEYEFCHLISGLRDAENIPQDKLEELTHFVDEHVALAPEPVEQAEARVSQSVL